MKKQRGYFYIDFTPILIFLFVAGVGVGVLLSWLIPALWSLVKPLIHSWTM